MTKESIIYALANIRDVALRGKKSDQLMIDDIIRSLMEMPSLPQLTEGFAPIEPPSVQDMLRILGQESMIENQDFIAIRRAFIEWHEKVIASPMFKRQEQQFADVSV